MNVVLHIERLLLDGLPLTAAQGAQVRAAVERELARMLAGGGVADALRGGGAVPQVPAPHIALAPAERPDAIGRHVARALHASIGGQK